MTIYIRQIECLNCSNYRGFVHHTEAGQRLISQEEVRDLYRRAVLTCGRCGSASLILGWTDPVPYLPPDTVLRRRRRRNALTVPMPEANQ
jgi:hypothetical protein